MNDFLNLSLSDNYALFYGFAHKKSDFQIFKNDSGIDFKAVFRGLQQIFFANQTVGDKVFVGISLACMQNAQTYTT